MRLNSVQRRSLFRFLSLYIFAVFLTVGGFSYLYYTIKSEQLTDGIYHELKERAFSIASQIVEAQMQKRPFRFEQGEDVVIVGKEGVVHGSFSHKVDIKRDFYIEDGRAYYVDRSARGHLGVEAIIVRDESFGVKHEEIVRNTLWLFGGALLFLLAIGSYLGRLFLEPMRQKLEEIDRFVKDSTHELNTPVTTLLLAAQKIEQKGAQSNYLRSLKMAAAKISKIYKDLSFLAFEKEPQPQEVEVAEVVRKALDFFEILIEQKGLDLREELEPCTLYADESHIELLVSNLLDNAIKYAPPQTPLRILLKKCRLEIENRGIIEDIDVIFQRYVRAEHAQGGFGLGLDIVRSVADKYGYEIEVESKEGIVRFSVKFEEA